MAIKVILYVEVDGQIWLVMNDGSWQPLSDTDSPIAGIPLLTNITEIIEKNAAGELTFNYDNQSIVIDPNALQFGSTPHSTTNNDASQTAQETSSGTLGQATRLQIVSDEVIAQAGYQTLDYTPPDATPNDSVNAELVGKLRIDAKLTVYIEDGADATLNRFEVPNTVIHGEAFHLEDGRIVVLAITDSAGNHFSFSSTVFAEKWALSAQDLSLLSEGPLTVIATITDQYLNTVSAQTASIKDTLAQLTLEIDSGNDAVINQQESLTTTLSGEIGYVENGQTVHVIVTDSGGARLLVETTITAGVWQVEVDLSALLDGQLSITASTIDIAGNPAAVTGNTLKDSQAGISLRFENSANDNVINQFEQDNENLFGAVSNVENGHLVTVVVTDSLNYSETFSSTVVAGLWAINAADLSLFSDGLLTAVATVIDDAGNVATATSTIVKDVAATITLNIETGDDNWLNANEVQNVMAYGSVTGIEDGQIVTLTATDSAGTVNSITAVVINGGYALSGLDLSAVAQGALNVIASVNDLAGNPALASALVHVDTLARIVVNIETAGDGVLNASEVSTTTINGITIKVDDGELVDITVTDINGLSVTLQTSVANSFYSISGDLSSLAEGPLRVTAQVSDFVGNVATAVTSAIKDTTASITFTIDDGGDGWLNASEIVSVSGYGDATGIEDGQVVTIVATDSAGNTAQMTSTVIGGVFSLSGIDLSGFVDGQFSATASVTDLAGNPATATDTVLIDTLADLSLNIESNGDGVLNAAEVSTTKIYGHAADVNDGAMVTITVSDELGHDLTFSAVVTNNKYTLLGADLSSLEEGLLTAIATVIDVHGNIATANANVEKDTVAQITFVIEEGGDGWLNSAEISSVSGAGTVTNIEDGNVVTITATDGAGNVGTITALVAGGQYQISGLDLSHFVDGPLTAVATVCDNAGNPATSQDSVNIDTLAAMTIVIESAGDAILNSNEIATTQIHGATLDIENGALVSVSIRDINGKTLVFTASVLANQYVINNADLSSLAEGALSATASVFDAQGNSANASTNVIKDTLASLTIVVQSGSDNVLNGAEVLSTDISGTSLNIEDNQNVSVVVSDGSNNLTFNTTIIAGAWSIGAKDLSSLNEGQLTFTASSEDIAGNPAIAATNVNKDTEASITINFEQQGADSLLNAVESSNENLFGSVSHVENGQFVSVTVTDAAGTLLTFKSQVIAGHWLVPKSDLSSLVDGTLTAQVTVLDQAGNSATASSTIIKDSSASISVIIDSGADAYINSSEVTSVTINGAVTGIEDGQVVTLTISDANGNVIPSALTAVVTGGLWSVENIDLSALDEGTFTATAEVTDVAGNIATGSDDAIKDVLAATLISINDHGDGYLNSVEIGNVSLSGLVAHIEDGQTVNVTITDSLNATGSGTATISAGKWQVDGLDLSAFAEGELTATATIIDSAGNIASATDTVIKDTLAQLTVSIESGGDNLLNASELNPVSVFGNVTDVEDGQIVSFTVSDGVTNTGPFTATVNAGIWQSTVDFSAFKEGNVSVTASVSDLSGNAYNAIASVVKDSLASISIDIKTDSYLSDNVINAAESKNTQISGTTANIEDGQVVTVTVVDGAGNTLTFNTMVNANNWSLPSVDLSSLIDGSNNILATATVSDIAGNTATENDSASKDTLASISVVIDSDADNLLNSAEMSSVTINGAVTNIEDGQTVNLLLNDQSGHQMTLTATVASGTFQLNGVDLSSLSDGLIELTAQAIDLAGNPAVASDNAIKDTQVSIDIDTDSHNGFSDYPGFNSYNFMTGAHTEIGGTSSAEPGQTVTLTISDATNSVNFSGVVDSSGRWLVDNIDISSLDETAVWSVQAAVTDLAGNAATDEMPDLNLVTPMVFSEDDFAAKAISASTVLEINNINTTLSFTPNQPQLNAVTSEGQSVSSVLAGDGLSIEVRRDGDGQLVLSAIIDPVSGTVSITMFEPLDHPLGSDQLVTELFVKAVQSDVDGTTETTVMPVIFLVNDSTPVAQADNYIVTEDKSSSGNLLLNDSAIDGYPLVNAVTYDGVTQNVAVGASALFNTNKGQLTVNYDGTWTFIAAHNLDNSQEQFIDFTYQIIDLDGDIDSASGKISIVDGAAGQMNNASASFNETTVNLTAAHLQTFTINAGSDDLVAASITFTPAILIYLDALGLTSNGEAITFSFNGAHTAVIASTNSLEIFTISLSAINNGADLTATTIFTQTQPLDHLSSESLKIDFSVIAVDTDGTEINTGVFNWTVKDGQNAAIKNDSQVNLNEADLISAAVTGEGTLTVTPGSDNSASIAFDITKQPDLTAGGEVIQYKLEGDSLVAFTGSSPEVKIFTVSLTGSLAPQSVSQLGYSVTLFEAIDQLDNNGNHIDSLAIAIVVSVTDGDQDITDQNLIINISDSGSAMMITSDMHVTELPASPNTPGQFTNNDATLITISADLDPITQIGLNVSNNAAVLLSDGSALTQNSQAVVWQVNKNGDYKGVLADGTVVFTVLLPASIHIAAGTSADINLDFSLLGPVDHPKALHDHNLEIVLPVLATDSDKTSTQFDIKTEIDDGKLPSLVVTDTLNLDENTLLVSNDSDNITFKISSGSDQVVAVQPALAGQEIPGLSSAGLPVSFAVAANDSGWWLATNSDGEQVFKVKFNLDGTINAQLIGPVDHPDSSSADILSIAIDIEAVDADGDKSSLTAVTINFQDDLPTVSHHLYILQEGQTEILNLLANNQTGADGGAITNIHLYGNDYAPGTLIKLYTADNGTEYGTLQINSDGSGELTTYIGVYHQGLTILDLVQYTITDGDGDQSINTLILDIADQPGEVTIEDTVSIEDLPLTLTLVVSVGDNDNNEAVDEVVFKQASLLGGTLTFNDNALATNGDGDYVLNGSDFIPDGNGNYVPNGALIYIPLLNSSDQTQTVILAIDAIISRDNGLGGRATETVNNNIQLTIESDADAPIWNQAESTFVYNISEDAALQNITIKADLFDLDGSETMTYVLGNIDSGLSLTLKGSELVAGATVSAADIGLIKAQVAAGLAGILSFDITPMSTEAENNDQQAGPLQTVTFNVLPVADTPHLVVTDLKGLEDQILLLNEALNGQLTDTDGSESLSYEITVPTGWSVVAITGSSAVVVDLGAGIYRVEGSDVSAGQVGLLPALHVSSETGSFFIKAQAIATESVQDGLSASPVSAASAQQTFQVFLQGVVDTPSVIAGGDWGVDPDNAQKIINTSPVYEDQLIALNIAISTPDQDGSESINLLLSNLPEGFIVTDASGTPSSLAISHFDSATGNAVFQVTLAELQNLYLKPLSDFSGKVSFNVDTIITEADGDSKPDGVSGSLPDDSLFALIVEIEITPVIDSNAGNAGLQATGVEDLMIPINLLPNTDADSDGSESVTAFSVTGLPAGMALYFDGIEISAPVDIATLIDATSTTLTALLSSGRFAVKAPTDASGHFNIGISYEITDLSESGVSVTSSTAIIDNLDLFVRAEVEDLTSPDNNDKTEITRLETSTVVQVNHDATPISLAGLVQFYDQDNDGSEFIDYIVIQVPKGDNWLVTHSTNLVIHDGEGRWLIDATGLTSSSLMENGSDLLAGVSIYTYDATLLPSQIAISAHVIDGDDKEMINGSLQVHFTANGAESIASAIDNLQIAPISGDEDSNINIGSQINTSVAGDDNDILSFKILASDLPQGGIISGTGVIIDYDTTGKYVVQYLFTEASLSSLHLSAISEDFAGTFEVPITTIATDGVSGDTRVEIQTLQFEIAPIVDGAVLVDHGGDIFEDTLTPLKFSVLFADSNITNQGIESITALILDLVDGGVLVAPAGVLTDLGAGRWQVNDLSQVDKIAYQAPLNMSGLVNINVDFTIVDTAQGYSQTLSATSNVSNTITLDILPVTDSVDISSATSRGDEDSYISLAGLAVNFIDNDGSETMSIEISGVPSGAVLVLNNGGGSYSILPNDGVDGGSFEGKPTYKWSVDESQLANLAIRPPLDFSGDIPMSVTVIGYEKGTTDYVTSEGDFILEVLPIADTVLYQQEPAPQTGIEGQVSHFDLAAASGETFSNETLIISVTVAASSDNSAFFGLDRIRAGGVEASFVMIDGAAVALLEIPSDQLTNGFELLTGPNAFGHFDIVIALFSKDVAIVGGVVETDISDNPIIFDTTLDLTAVVDIPTLTLQVDSIVSAVGSDASLLLHLQLLNPDPDNESGFVEITGLPAGVSIIGASQSGDVWTVPQDNLDNATLTGLSTAQTFDLSITPIAQLNGEQAIGAVQTIKVNVQADNGVFEGDANNNLIIAGAGDDQISSGAGSDRILFNSGDQGSIGAPANDSISDFSVGSDSIDLTGLLGGVDVTTVTLLDNYIDLIDNGIDTTMTIKLDGINVVQNITLDNTSLDDLYGSNATGISEVDILTRMLQDQSIITGQS